MTQDAVKRFLEDFDKGTPSPTIEHGEPLNRLIMEVHPEYDFSRDDWYAVVKQLSAPKPSARGVYAPISGTITGLRETSSDGYCRGAIEKIRERNPQLLELPEDISK
jgi:hypothetical protein